MECVVNMRQRLKSKTPKHMLDEALPGLYQSPVHLFGQFSMPAESQELPDSREWWTLCRKCVPPSPFPPPPLHPSFPPLTLPFSRAPGTRTTSTP